MRVIAGSARGRPLRAPAGDHTRPTSDKAKGAAFSMLEAEAFRRGFLPDEHATIGSRFASAVCWPRVLELFAGSGALTIEALSRGAERADLVETDREARLAIKQNLVWAGLEGRAAIHRLRADLALAALGGPYDLVLLDPPYDEPGVVELIQQLANPRLSASTAVLVWEHPRTVSSPDRIDDQNASPWWRRVKTNTHGATAISLYAADGAG